MTILYTTAPQAYDGFGTVELDPAAGTDNRGITLRKVSVPADAYEWQTGRYASGLHGVATEHEARRFPTIYRITEHDQR